MTFTTVICRLRGVVCLKTPHFIRAKTKMQAFLKKGSRTGEASPLGAPEKQKERRKAPTPWVEKYRPKTVDDVVEQEEVVAVLRDCLSGSDLPNLLLYGPPGTGKTSTILAAARQLFGDMFRDRILELNASDERGIDVVRGKVKRFSQLAASGTRPDGKPCPPFKIVILDEADSMTHAAQAALRRTMEKESHTTRFCLVCNYVSRIIEPITSRCTKFRFKPLRKDQIFERLTEICEKEELQIGPEAIRVLIDCSGGDLRRAITLLQSSSRINDNGEPITEQQIRELSGMIPDEVLVKFLECCRDGDYNKFVDFVEGVFQDGYSVGQLMEQLNEHVVCDENLSMNQKSLITIKIAECLAKLQEAASEYLQFLDLGCVTIKVLRNN